MCKAGPSVLTADRILDDLWIGCSGKIARWCFNGSEKCNMLVMFQVLAEAGMAVHLVAAAADMAVAVAVAGREDSVGVGTAAVVGDSAVVDTAVAVDGREDSAVVVTVAEAEADMAEAVVVVK